LPGGSQVLAQAFLQQLKVIKTNSTVSAISQDKDGVTVKAGAVGYRADYVVVAVPLRALAKIQLQPALDAAHQAALKSTNYGWRDQILLKFKTPVWDSKARLSGEIFSDQGLGMLWIEPAVKGGANVLINLSGDNARLLKSFGDRQVADQVLIRLHAFYPKARGAYSGYEMRRYSADAGVGGAYLAFGPGQMSRFWQLWAQPQQRIAFAGEHTEALYPGTLEGALRSGKRAAEQVQLLSRGQSTTPAKIPVLAEQAKPAADTQGFFGKLFN
jgi:monoamine oxidase